MAAVVSNVLLNLANDFTHAQAYIPDNIYRSDDTEYYIYSTDPANEVAEKAYQWGSFAYGFLTTTIESGTILVWRTSFDGIATSFTWSASTLETPAKVYSGADFEYWQGESGVGLAVNNPDIIDYDSSYPPTAGPPPTPKNWLGYIRDRP